MRKLIAFFQVLTYISRVSASYQDFFDHRLSVQGCSIASHPVFSWRGKSWPFPNMTMPFGDTPMSATSPSSTVPRVGYNQCR